MSARHPKRSRCSVCREATEASPTRILIHRKLNRFGMWRPFEAVLCEACFDGWLGAFVPPTQPVEDWIGLVDGRMWPRRQVEHQGPETQRILRELDHARHSAEEDLQDVQDVDVSWERSN